MTTLSGVIASFFLLLTQATAWAQETINNYPDPRQGTPDPFSGEMAGWGGLVSSAVLGTIMVLDKIGALNRFGTTPNPQPPVPKVSPIEPKDLENINTRLATLETRLAAVEQTVTNIDMRDRIDAAAIARIEGQISAWDARLIRIENAVVGRNRD